MTVVKGGKDGGAVRVPVQVKTGSKRCYGEKKCSKSKFIKAYARLSSTKPHFEDQ